jgi:hypothetical protein
MLSEEEARRFLRRSDESEPPETEPWHRFAPRARASLRRHRFTYSILSAVTAVALVLGGWGLLRGSPPPRVPVVAASQSASPSTGGCPDDALALPPDGIAPAAQAALAQAAEVYGGIDTDGARAEAATRAMSDTDRGPEVERACGRRARRRSVVVFLSFPEMRGSASLSQGVVFVARFEDGYAIWERSH